MVYCGRPSRGCQMCRARRIKCDEAKPTCGQCTKSRRQCPGYKDDFDLVFRNETKATERRAQRASKKALALKAQNASMHQASSSSASVSASASGVFSTSSFSAASGSNSSGNGSNAANPGTMTVASTLGLPLEEHASCHFLSNFVLLPQDGSTVGHMDFIMPLIKQEGPDSHIQHAFNACSMTFLNNVKGVGDKCWDKALNEYSMALARTNAALRDPKTQLSDATLAAVLLLGMFENISAKQINMFNWGSHVEGAIQLVEARGKKQIKTKVGLQLFIAVRTVMIIYCLSASKAPNMGAEWWLEDTTFSSTAQAVQRIMIKTSEVRACAAQLVDQLSARSPGSTELMMEVIRRAQALDQEVVAWQRGVPSSWHHRTIAWEDSVTSSGGDYANAEVFPGRVDVFEGVWIGSIANSARAVRLILHSIIVRCAAWVCAPVDYRTTPEYATAAGVCRDAITDIIASVPYFLGWHLKRKGNSRQYKRKDNVPSSSSSSSSSFPPTSFSSSASSFAAAAAAVATDDGGDGGDQEEQPLKFGTFACGEEDCAKGLAGYLITWPLTCVISQDYATDAQRAWVMGRLAKVGSELGVRYALAMCQLQMRVPSMLIRRDALVRSAPPPAAATIMTPAATVGGGGGGAGMGMGGRASDDAFRKIAAARLAPPAPGHVLNPQQQWEAVQQMKVDKGKAELIGKLTKDTPADEGAQIAAQRWLKI